MSALISRRTRATASHERHATRTAAVVATVVGTLSIACVDTSPPWPQPGAHPSGGSASRGSSIGSYGGATDAPLQSTDAGGQSGSGGASRSGSGGTFASPSPDADPDVSIATGGAPTSDGPIEVAPGLGGTFMSGGTSGRSGSGGQGGATGGATNTGGTIVINCSNPVVPDNGNPPVNGMVTDFSHWDPTIQKWGRDGNVSGTLFKSASGDAVISDIKVEGNPVGMHVVGSLSGGSRASVGLQFLTCATVASFSYVRFTYYGSESGCSVALLIHTLHPSAAGGGCALDGGVCDDFPRLDGVINSSATSATPITKLLSSFRQSTASWTSADARQVVGMEWQLSSSGGAPCSFDITIPAITFLQ